MTPPTYVATPTPAADWPLKDIVNNPDDTLLRGCDPQKVKTFLKLACARGEVTYDKPQGKNCDCFIK